MSRGGESLSPSIGTRHSESPSSARGSARNIESPTSPMNSGSIRVTPLLSLNRYGSSSPGPSSSPTHTSSIQYRRFIPPIIEERPNPNYVRLHGGRLRSRSYDTQMLTTPVSMSIGGRGQPRSANISTVRLSTTPKQLKNASNETSIALAQAKSRNALKENDSMVYIDGPQVYTCVQCRTHLTSHDDIISKSFHGMHGRAYLFDQCVNVTVGPAQDRRLMTGLHSVRDIFCKRCKGMIGWTYDKAYEHSQKYKEGKFIIEKINLHIEESDYYNVSHPAGERSDRWRKRSMSWGSERDVGSSWAMSPRRASDVIYEYSCDQTISSESGGHSPGGNTRVLRLSETKDDIPIQPTL